MRTIIFITGKQGVGKSIIADKIENSTEVHSIKEVKEAAKNRPPYAVGVVENIVFTSNDISMYPEFRVKLKKICAKHPRKLIEINIDNPF